MRKLKIKSFLYTRDDNGYNWFTSYSSELNRIQKSMDYFINPMKGLQIKQRFFIKIIPQKIYAQIFIYNMQNLGTDEHGRPIKILTGWHIETTDFNYAMSNLSLLMTYYYDYCMDKASLIENFKKDTLEIDLNTFIKETLSENNQLKEFRLKVDNLLTESNWNQIIINELEDGIIDFEVTFLKNAEKPKWNILKKVENLILFIILLFVFTSCGETNKPPQEQHPTHTYSTIWSKNETKHWKECSCGAKTEENAHSFGEWEIIESATTTKEGLKEQTCSICSFKKKEKINKVNPVYEWKSIDLLQPTMIVGGTSKVVLDEKGQKQNFVDLVDRQLDMLAQEIISRLEYVYGNANENKTHTITDKLHNNSTFTTYQTINAISEPLSSQPKYTVYNNQDKQESTMGYIMMRNGEKVVYDENLHTHYITQNGTKYAAVCSANMAGIFTSETALQATFEAQNHPTIDHVENSYNHEGILTLKGAIYGTPTWEYEEKKYGTQIEHEYKFNTSALTSSWNWSSYFKDGTAKDRLKSYLVNIISNNLTNYRTLRNINLSDASNNINEITEVYNYIINFKEVIFKLITKEIIGEKCYSNDLLAGQTGDYIAKNLYSAHELLHTTVQDEYYNNGKFIQLYSKAFSNS